MNGLRNVTLGFLVKDNQVLLAMKKRGFGVGWWNGFGGKLEGEETLEQGLIREAQEEINVTPQDFEDVATLDFYFQRDDQSWDQRVHVFLVSSWDGQPCESEEMKPKWFEKNKLPVDKMWKADRIWLPKVLTGEKIKAKIVFDKDAKLVEYTETC